LSLLSLLGLQPEKYLQNHALMPWGPGVIEYWGKEKYPLLQHSNTPINSRFYIMSAF